MKLPRDVSGAELIQHLCKHWHYRKIHQVGSHVLLVSEEPAHHRIPVPLHKPLGTGLLKAIVREVCQAKGVNQEELLRHL